MNELFTHDQMMAIIGLAIGASLLLKIVELILGAISDTVFGSTDKHAERLSQRIESLPKEDRDFLDMMIMKMVSKLPYDEQEEVLEIAESMKDKKDA